MTARGILTIAALKSRCTIDPASHCWIWHGATTHGGTQPRVWTLDHARVEKRCMTGPMAAWNIAHGAAPREGHCVYRACQRTLCLNPAHLREAATKADIGLHIRRMGSRKGTAMEARQANIRAALQARGITPTSPDLVRAIRAEGEGPTNLALQAKYGVLHSVISRIRRGESHKGVV